MPIIQFHSKSKKTEPPFAPTAMKDLSNFSDHSVVYGGNTYKSVEHAFQALKYSCTNRPELVDIVRVKFADKTAVEAKSSGSRAAMIKWKVELNIACWEKQKVGIMRDLIASKMERHPEIRQTIKTAKENNITLVHFSRSDMYWGAHVTDDGTAIKKGQNMLGNLFMSYYNTIDSSDSSSSSISSVSSSSSSSSNTSGLKEAIPNRNVKELITFPQLKTIKTKTKKMSPIAKTKECPPDKIRNPATKRCVSKTSKLGKSILANQLI